MTKITALLSGKTQIIYELSLLSTALISNWYNRQFGSRNAFLYTDLNHQGLMTEAEAPILWPPDKKSQFTGKDPDAGKD